MKDLFLPEAATIIEKKTMTKNETYFSLTLDSGKSLGHGAGQFAEVSIPGIGEAPISISSHPGSQKAFEMVIRKAGNVTGAIHSLNKGDKIGIRGPFGTQFPVDTLLKGKDLIIACGGLGLVPLRSAIGYILEHRKDYGRVTILVGTKSPEERLFTDELRLWQNRSDLNFQETVDRGGPHWKGHTGVITTLMSDLTIDRKNTYALLCGPPVMYKFVLLELMNLSLPFKQIYLSLERRMKCGIGKCGHCQINGYYTCKDGPVFKFSDLRNVREAI